MQQFKKKADDCNMLQQELDDLETNYREKEDIIRNLEVEVASFKSSRDTIKTLRDEISKGKVRISQLELEIQNQSHQLQDSQNQMEILKKRDE